MLESGKNERKINKQKGETKMKIIQKHRDAMHLFI